MNFLGSFWIASLAGSLLSTQHPLQPNNQDASQPPEAASPGDTSPSIDVSALESELNLNLFLASQSSYAPRISLLSCNWGSCLSKRSSVTFKSLTRTDHFIDFIDFPAGKYLEIGDLMGFPNWMQTGENRFQPPDKLESLASISTAPGFKASSLESMSPRLSGPIHLLDLKPSPQKFRSYLKPLSQWTKNLEFENWFFISDVKVIPAIQPKPEDSSELKDKGPDQVGPFPLKHCFNCKTKLADTSNTQLAQWFQVWVKDHLVAEVASQQTADLLAQRFRDLLYAPDLDLSALHPAMVDGLPAAKAGDEVLFTVKEAFTAPNLDISSHYDNQKLAVEWVNNLRLALGKSPLTIVSAEGHPLLKKTEKRFKGTASWYGPYFHGRLTATGETFDQNDLTAAHPSLPFDTYLQVRNLLNDKTVVVRINDRGPYIGDRSLDLSREAARRLDSETIGVIPYEAVVMEPFSLEDSESPLTSLSPY